MPRRAVYRGLVGGYEELREEPAALSGSKVDFICITDDPNLTSTTWRIVVQAPRVDGDSTRSARYLKILGHPCLDEYEETLWVDNTVELKHAPDQLFEKWLDGVDIAAPLHSFRASILAEAEVIIDTGLDDFARVYEQMTAYLGTCPGALEENPHWTGMLARRRSDATERAMHMWWEHVLRYSRRDQLSFIPAVRAHDLRLRSIPLDARESPWHAWPRAQGRDSTRQLSSLRAAMRPAAGRIGELQQALHEVTQTLTSAVEHREELIAQHEEVVSQKDDYISGLTAELSRLEQERQDLSAQLQSSQGDVQRLHQRVVTKSERLRKLRRKLERLERTALRGTPVRRSRARKVLDRIAQKARHSSPRG